MIYCCGECKHFKESQQEIINHGMAAITCTHASNNVGAYSTWKERNIDKLGAHGNEICTNFIKG